MSRIDWDSQDRLIVELLRFCKDCTDKHLVKSCDTSATFVAATTSSDTIKITIKLFPVEKGGPDE